MNPRPGRQSQQTGRARLAALSQEWEGAEDRLGVQRARFARLADPASQPAAVVADQLFQTPEPLAARLAGLLAAGSGPILEPSAGLGRLYRAVRALEPAERITLVEVAPQCAAVLYAQTAGDEAARLVQGDFLTMDADRLGTFGRIIMNPPYRQGEDVKHIRHALSLLEPGGLLVALCADGPRQRAALQPLADSWESLPPGSFRSEGTDVEAALLTIRKQGA